MLVASIGLIRLPDVYCRMHAATKATTFGMGGILLGASLIFQSATVTTQALLAIFFLFLTAPVAAHLISRAAYKRGPDLCAETTHDEYGEIPGGATSGGRVPATVRGRVTDHHKLGLLKKPLPGSRGNAPLA